MDFAVVGSDPRFGYLAEILRERGVDARLTSDESEIASAKNVVAEGNDPRTAAISPKATAFLWGNSPHLSERIAAHNLLSDERLLLENAWLTAEGAVSAAMREGVSSIIYAPCLIIGWGRIGRALTEILVGLNAQVTVASRTQKNRAVERGAEGICTDEIENAIVGKKYIFSTAPAMVLDAERLALVDRDALIIDLASPPYGVDVDFARSIGLRAWREPKLPGRYCPKTAAEVLLRGILRAKERG